MVNFLQMGLDILKGCVHVLVFLCSHGRPCEEFVSNLCWITLCELLSKLTARGSVARLWGGVRHFDEVISDLAIYSGSSLLFRLCMNNMFG